MDTHTENKLENCRKQMEGKPSLVFNITSLFVVTRHKSILSLIHVKNSLHRELK